MPTPIRTAPAVPAASLRRTAVQHSRTSNNPRMTRVPSLTASRSEAIHAGTSATAPATDRYADTEAPFVTSVASASPSPPGDSHTVAPAPAPSSATEPSRRVTRKFF